MNKILLFTILAVILLSVSFTSVSASPESEQKLMDKIKSLEKKIKDLLSESAKIKKENYKLKSENAKVKDENAKLKSENTNLKSENANLKTSSTKYTSPPESTQSTTPKESTQSTTTKDNLSKSSLYSQAVEWNYKDMQRNPEKYQGKVIAVTGIVYGVKWSMTDDYNYYPNYYDMITPDGLVVGSSFFFLVYDGILLADDKISVVGYVEGYITDWGDPKPIIKVAYLEFID